MKTFRTSKGPFSERPYYKDEEIERIKEQIGSAVEEAISDNTSVWDWIAAGGNMANKPPR